MLRMLTGGAKLSKRRTGSMGRCQFVRLSGSLLGTLFLAGLLGLPACKDSPSPAGKSPSKGQAGVAADVTEGSSRIVGPSNASADASPIAPARATGRPEPKPRRPEPKLPNRPAATYERGPSPQLVDHSGSLVPPIEYVVVEPVNAPPDTPLVVALHGRGDTPEAFGRLARRLRLPVRTIVARGPMRWGSRDGRAWFDLADAQGSEQLAQRLLDLETLVAQLAKTYPGSPKPVVYGFSQGAVLALQAVARKPELFTAVAALSGFLPEPDRGVKASAPVPLLLTAGKKDKVITPARTKAAVAALGPLGHAPKLVEFEGGHQIPPAVLVELRTFLLQHARKTTK